MQHLSENIQKVVFEITCVWLFILNLVLILAERFNEHPTFTLKDETSENVHDQFQKLMIQLNKSHDAYDLKASNGIYGAKEFPFLQVNCTRLCIPLICILGLTCLNGHM